MRNRMTHLLKRAIRACTRNRNECVGGLPSSPPERTESRQRWPETTARPRSRSWNGDSSAHHTNIHRGPPLLPFMQSGFPQLTILVEFGAGGRGRTGVDLLGPRDFKSLSVGNVLLHPATKFSQSCTFTPRPVASRCTAFPEKWGRNGERDWRDMPTITASGHAPF